MEGPSLYLATEQLAPFVNQKVRNVSGNTKIDKERLQGKMILDIFSWGKHLVFQFDTFALRVHFLLFGSFEAFVKGKNVAGDYPKKNRQARLQFECKNGEIALFSCSLKFIESAKAKDDYDFTTDIMSRSWNTTGALKKLLLKPERRIDDVLLDQTLFSGVVTSTKMKFYFLKKHPLTNLLELFPLSNYVKSLKRQGSTCSSS